MPKALLGFAKAARRRAGEYPGENAIDVKVVKSNRDDVTRMKITARDTIARSWKADSYISNKAVFNMKEKVRLLLIGSPSTTARLLFVFVVAGAMRIQPLKIQ